MTRLLAIVLFAFVGATATAQEPLPSVPWANKFFIKDKTPSVIVHDFGTVPGGTVCSHKFTITNIYDVPMQVIAVKKSCTCLEAYPPSNLIQPNETAEITVTMDAGKFKGANSQTFYVTFGPQFSSTAVIRVSATSRADVALNPGQIAFGTVAQGATPTVTAGLKYQGRQRDWKVLGVASGTGPYEVKIEEPGTLALSNEYRVVVKLKADAASGPLTEAITLKTNDPTNPMVQLTVTGLVQAPLEINPKKVAFGNVPVGETVTQRVMVRAAKPFKVTAIADDGSGLSAEVFPAASPVQVVTVRYTPTKAGALNQTLTFKTDLAGGATVTLPVTAEAVAK